MSSSEALEKSNTETLNFTLLSQGVSEISDSKNWADKGSVEISEEELKEITDGDEKPFFVEFIALYEGMSNNKRIYTKEAVSTCVDAMVGVNMYKGHEAPGSSSWKYREPVGRIVGAKTKEVTIDGKKVLAAVGKAYISDSDPKLRRDIKKKMAGAVSILGDAKMVSRADESVKTVVMLKKPLKSVDFCNPSSGGLPHAGVTAVVSEMAGNVEETTKETIMTKKLTKDELLAEYKPEIMALISEQTISEIEAVGKQARELALEKQKFEETKRANEATISEMTSTITSTKNEIAEWKKKYETERDARIASELNVYQNALVAEMSAAKNGKLVELASKRVKPVVIDGDLEKSKANLKNSLESAYAEVASISEMFGSNPAPEQKPKTKNHEGNPVAKTGTTLDKILSPSLRKQKTS